MSLNDLFRQIQPQVEGMLRGRKDALYQNVLTDKELDDITREELLADLRQAGLPGTGGLTPNDQLDYFEKLFATLKVDQSQKMQNRRSVSGIQKERKDRPGLGAQTILTQNLNMSQSPGGALSGGQTLLTKTT